MHINLFSNNLVHFVSAAVYELCSNNNDVEARNSFLERFYRDKTLKNIISAHEEGAKYIIGIKPEYVQRYKADPLFNANDSIVSVSNIFRYAMQGCPANSASIFFQEQSDFTWFFNLPMDQQVDFIKGTERADPRYFSIESTLLAMMDSIVNHFHFVIELANDNVRESTIKLIMDDNQISIDSFKPFITKKPARRRSRDEQMFIELQKLFAKTQYFKDSLSAHGVSEEDIDKKIQILRYLKSECEENIGSVDYQTLFKFLRKEINYYFEHEEWDANLYALGKLFIPKSPTFDKIIEDWYKVHNINNRQV